MSELSADDANGVDGEGVWSPDVEQSFQEALRMYPACGRRKTILPDEGSAKMYGRNELIARYIKLRTGKTRTRKQVSSHIQVLARRKAKSETTSGGASTSNTPSPSSGHSISSYQQRPTANHHAAAATMMAAAAAANANINPPTALPHHHHHHQLNHNNHHQHQQQQHHHHQQPLPAQLNGTNPIAVGALQGAAKTPDERLLAATQQQQQQQHQLLPPNMGQHYYDDLWADRHIVTPKIRLVEFSAFIEHRNFQQYQHHPYVQIDYSQAAARQTNKLERIDISQIQDKFPEIGGPDGMFQRAPPDSFFLVKFWADINDHDHETSYANMDDQNYYFGFSSHFETNQAYKDITCSTKACSYGHQVVEKVDKIYGAFNSSNGRYSYGMSRSPMCEFMIQFIKKLRQLKLVSYMNSVLENFTVLQVITSESSGEILLCLAYVFEVAPSLTDHSLGPQYNVYKLTKD